ncbi:hypothetical protein WR25_01915 isoform P [Diploscapter pachys]|uniref:Nucleoprotein TPR n=1 Tax=Diploscapter pachys TaxID=2018661 RepID=A0A2A2JSL9_9BILA|nr:hypothetical protein WR25_01915 isoform C [Diploscapter pachys]PAV64655.1 hypothetical protein WR25_01915 isoform H [Diploscapter pachys]PAV64657.1 hypothetical protein WR25_01915 isoform J [Diploscapter pachys]PAV64661.1 hypothetical protein WR25_01915 isoform N [Diploscapter pachys]PAV64663.1 hypothetical protein WR25_01915 isoform P [Diploscapter pachys]
MKGKWFSLKISMFQLEKEKFESEKVIFEETRKWFTQEIANRDNQISALRIEAANKEMSLSEVTEKCSQETDKLKKEIEGYNSQIELSKKQYDELRKKMEEMVDEHSKEIKEVERQLQVQTGMTRQMQGALDKADQVTRQLHDQLSARNEVFVQTQKVLEEVKQEILDRQLAHDGEMGKKEAQLNELREELRRITQLVQGRNRVHVDMTEEQLAHLSPVAAETAKLIRGGKSLTDMIRDHAQLAGELAEAREISRQYETTIREMCAEIEKRAPQFAQQKKLFEQSYDENVHLRDQLKEAEEARKEVLTDRDNALNELAFSKAEIQRVQRDFARVNRQLNHLMFANEKQRIAEEEGTIDESFNDERLYKSIVEIRHRNLELEAELENERASAAHAFREQQNAELEKLSVNLELSQQKEQQVNEELEKLNACYATLKEQAEKLKNLVDNSVGIEEMRMAKLKTEEAVAKAREAEMKINRLEEYNNMLKEEKDKREKFLEERFNLSEANVQSMRATNAKLEVAFEAQKKQTEDATMQVDSLLKDLEQVRRDNDKLKLEDGDKLGKIRQLNEAVAAAQQEISSLKVQYRVALDDAEAAKRENGMLKGQIDVLKDNVEKERDQLQAVSDLNKRMTKIEESKIGETTSQLEIIKMERDSLKSTSSSLTEQINMLRIESRQIQTRHEQEVVSMRVQIEEKQQQLTIAEKQLSELRDKLTANALAQQQQQNEADNVSAMPIDRMRRECLQLKTQTQQLENENTDLRKGRQDIEAELAKIHEERKTYETTATELEKALNETKKLHEQEQEQLKKRMEEITAEKDGITGKLKTLEERYGKVAEIAKRYRGQAEEQKKKIDSIEAEMAQLKSRPTPAGQLASATMAGKIPPGGVSKQEHEAALNQLRQQLDAANKEKEAAENSLQLTELRMRAVNSQMEKMNDTSKQLTEENERLKKKIQDMEQEISLTLATAGGPAAMSTPKRSIKAATDQTVVASPEGTPLAQKTAAEQEIQQTAAVPPVQQKVVQRASFFSNPVIETVTAASAQPPAPAPGSQFKWIAGQQQQQQKPITSTLSAVSAQPQSQSQPAQTLSTSQPPSVVSAQVKPQEQQAPVVVSTQPSSAQTLASTEEKRMQVKSLFGYSVAAAVPVPIASSAQHTQVVSSQSATPSAQQPFQTNVSAISSASQQQAQQSQQQAVTSSQPVSAAVGSTATVSTPTQQLKIVPESAEHSVSEESVTKAAATSSATSVQPPATSSSSILLSPGQTLFGKSAPQPSSTSQATEIGANVIMETLTPLRREPPAQSSFVSGSQAADATNEEDITQNDSPSESRDSASGTAPVSSSDASRKRTAAVSAKATGSSIDDMEMLAKRQRESPSEAVTSSEEQRREGDRERDDLGMELEGSSRSNEAAGVGMEIEERQNDEAADDAMFNEQDVEEADAHEEEMEDNEEILSDEGMEDEELEVEGEGDRDSDEQDLGEDEDIQDFDEPEEHLFRHSQQQQQQRFPARQFGQAAQRRPVQADDNDEIVILSSDDDDGNDNADNANDSDVDQQLEDEEDGVSDEELEEINDDVEEELANQDEQLRGLYNEDREAASAIEEADDEGRGSSQAGGLEIIPEEGQVADNQAASEMVGSSSAVQPQSSSLSSASAGIGALPMFSFMSTTTTTAPTTGTPFSIIPQVTKPSSPVQTSTFSGTLTSSTEHQQSSSASVSVTQPAAAVTTTESSASVPVIRMPVVFDPDRDDQCSSSNETNEPAAGSSQSAGSSDPSAAASNRGGRQTLPIRGRQTARRSRPGFGTIYRPPRGGM